VALTGRERTEILFTERTWFDVAFDTGLLTVDAGLQIHASGALSDAVRADPLARQYYGRPPLLDSILLPASAQPPACKYLDWHRTNVFAA
jgi:putative restriction endonuclease